MSPSPYTLAFPKLESLGWERTSEPAQYNCIAFAADDHHRAWWPGIYPPNSKNFWPVADAIGETLAQFYAAFATIGYRPCADGSLEVGYEKVAFYGQGGLVKHAAKQQSDGSWKSKLGKAEDIRHTLEGVEGPVYGTVMAFAERPLGPHRVV